MSVSVHPLPPFLQRPLGRTAKSGALTIGDTGGPTDVEYGFVDAATRKKIPNHSGARVTTAPGTTIQAPIDLPCGHVLPYVRDLDADTVVHAASPICVGAIVLVGGQSNELRLWAVDDPDAPAPDPRTRMYVDDSGWNGPAGRGWRAPTGGAITLLNTLAAQTGVPWALVSIAFPSMPLTFDGRLAGVATCWLDADGPAWTIAQRTIAAIGADVEAIVWGPGESDAMAGCSSRTFGAGLDELRQRLGAAITGRSIDGIPFGVAEVGDLTPVSADPSAVLQAQRAFVARTPNAFIASPRADLPLDGTIHLSLAGQRLQARRIAAALLRHTGAGRAIAPAWLRNLVRKLTG